MQTRREYLVSKGLAKPGRGKFSTLAKQALVEARLQGMAFSDGDTGSPVKTSTEKPAKVKPTGESAKGPVVGKSEAQNSLYVCPSDFRFPEGEYRAVAVIDGKRKVHSMRECCNTCRVSLTNHMCASPSVHGVAVVIERK